ncbi:MAG: peptidylprolyl isomerase [Propionibacteriaceae bacterium]|jgi:peptidyl-prolyl cis-trans isomerase B (cyclophilin B)|nr:peptidylprolyl isomerase [Propionibacteriaceae bacterium]
MRIRNLLPVVAVLLTVAVSGCSADDPAPNPSDSTRTVVLDKVICDYMDANAPAKPVDKPNGVDVPAVGTVTFTINFESGEVSGAVTLTMNRSKAPCTVNSFESLVEQGYYDDTSCHRSFAGAMFQCGDPSATGYGGPGYVYADEITPDTTSVYPRGVAAMANSGADTNGSQFFLVYNALPLDGAKYTIFATIDDESLAVLEALGELGQSPSDPYAPAQQVRIVSITKVD